jgi:hypothetical protein
MPGETDPSSLFLPQVSTYCYRLPSSILDDIKYQAPFHHCFVPTASSFSSAVAVSNPCEIRMDTFTMIATGA